MRILHVITSLEMGGAERLMLDLLPALIKRGNEVDLAVFNSNETVLYNELIRNGIRVYLFSGPGNVYNPRHIFHLFKLIKNYDIVHTHNTAPQYFAAICRCFYDFKLVTTEHSTSNRRRGNPILRIIDKMMYHQYDKIICISNQAETNLRKHLVSYSKSICTIYNGVNLKKILEAKPDEESQNKYRGKYLVVMVAGFRYEKDHPTLIKAFVYLPEKFHLLLVGDGVRRAEYEELINDLKLTDRVHMLGIRNDVPNILKVADVVVMSSHYEGLSLSNIEGMASGAPFIASDVDGLHEVTVNYGILFPEGDESALAMEIKKISEDAGYRDLIARKCMERASQYDISKMTEGYIAVYQSLV